MPLERISEHTLLTNFLSENSMILDLGANHGNFAKTIQHRFHSKMHLVEANPSLIGDLLKHFDHVLHAAVSDKDGQVFFNLSDNDEGSSLLNLPLGSDFAGTHQQTVTVQSFTLERIMQQFDLKHIDLLKVDIEGAETDLLISIDAATLAKVDQITVEFHCMHSFGYDLEAATAKAIDYLKQNGFIYFEASLGKKVDTFFLNRRFITEKRLNIAVLKLQALAANLAYARRQLYKKLAAGKNRN